MLVALLGAAPPSSRAQTANAESLTVEQCIAFARASAPDVEAAAASLAAARGDSTAVGFNRRPAFSVGGSAMVAPQGFYDPVVTNLGEYQAVVGMDWPLFDGGTRARARRRASLEAAASTAEWASAAREAGLRTATVALDLLRRQENERFQSDALEWLQDLTSMVESGVRSGVHARSDALRARLELATATTTLLDTRQALAALERELRELLRRPESEALRLKEPDRIAQRPPEPADSVRVVVHAAALPAVRQSEIEMARQRVALQEAQRKGALQFGLGADAGLKGADLTKAVPPDLRAEDPNATLKDRLRRDLGASVSVQIKQPLVDPTIRPTIVARQASLRAATLRREIAVHRARRDALDLLGRWRFAAVIVTLAEDAVTRADQNLLRLRSLYSGGGAGLLELLDARRQLDQARDRLTDARFQARQAYYEAEIP